MRRFIIKGLIILASVLTVDFAVGLVGKELVKIITSKNYSGQAALLGYNLQTATADIMIIGGSTASCHFIPSILSDSLSFYAGEKMTSFNAGAYYQQPTYSYCVLKSVIERRKPKVVIVEIQPQQLGGPTNYDALKPLRPYYNLNRNVKEILDENETWTNKLLLKLNMFRFNTEIIKLAASFRNPIGADGFDPKVGIIDNYVIAPEKDENTLNDIVVNEFEKLLCISKDNGIDLFVVMSPRLIYVDKQSLSFLKITELCKEYGINLFDFSTDVDLTRKEYFCDRVHLNYDGAKALTLKTCDLMKDYLSK